MKKEGQGGRRGSAPLELILGVGLILVPLALLALSFGPLIQRMVFVRIAAAEAARELVLTDGSEERAQQLVRLIALNHGLDPDLVGVGFCDAAPTPVTARPGSACGPLVKGKLLQVEITIDGAAWSTPYGVVGDVHVRASHTEMVGLYRSTP